MKPTSTSATICRRPGRSFRLWVSQMHSTVITPMMIHVITVDWGTGMPPNRGISKATPLGSRALNSALISSKNTTSLSRSRFDHFFHSNPRAGKDNLKKLKKRCHGIEAFPVFSIIFPLTI